MAIFEVIRALRYWERVYIAPQLTSYVEGIAEGFVVSDFCAMLNYASGGRQDKGERKRSTSSLQG